MPVPSTIQQSPVPPQPADMAGMLRRPTTPLTGAAALAMAPGHRFLLKHHWNAWEVASEGLEEPTWLPQLKRHTLRPGVNGTRTLGKNDPPEAAFDAAMVAEKRDGWTFLEQFDLDEEHRPEGVPEGPYCRQADARDPMTGRQGSVFLEAWQVPLPTLPGDEEGQKFKFDRAAYNRWRLWLVETGQINPPLQRVIDRVKGRYEARVPATKIKQYPTAEIGKAAVAKVEAVANDHINAAVPKGPAPVAPPAKPKKPKAKAEPPDAPKAAQ